MAPQADFLPGHRQKMIRRLEKEAKAAEKKNALGSGKVKKETRAERKLRKMIEREEAERAEYLLEEAAQEREAQREQDEYLY